MLPKTFKLDHLFKSYRFATKWPCDKVGRILLRKIIVFLNKREDSEIEDFFKLIFLVYNK
jgi:hypothetical protein